MMVWGGMGGWDTVEGVVIIVWGGGMVDEMGVGGVFRGA